MMAAAKSFHLLVTQPFADLQPRALSRKPFYTCLFATQDSTCARLAQRRRRCRTAQSDSQRMAGRTDRYSELREEVRRADPDAKKSMYYIGGELMTLHIWMPIKRPTMVDVSGKDPTQRSAREARVQFPPAWRRCETTPALPKVRCSTRHRRGVLGAKRTHGSFRSAPVDLRVPHRHRFGATRIIAARSVHHRPESKWRR